MFFHCHIWKTLWFSFGYVATRGIPCSKNTSGWFWDGPFLSRYGGQEHMEVPRELIFSQNENYVECGAQGWGPQNLPQGKPTKKVEKTHGFSWNMIQWWIGQFGAVIHCYRHFNGGLGPGNSLFNPQGTKSHGYGCNMAILLKSHSKVTRVYIIYDIWYSVYNI